MQIESEVLFGGLGVVGMVVTLGLSFISGSRDEGTEHGAINAHLKSISESIDKIDKDIERIHQDQLTSIRAIAKLEERVCYQGQEIEALKADSLRHLAYIKSTKGTANETVN